MKNILSDKLYKLIEPYLTEARKAPEPQSLKLLFNDNPNAKYFSILSKIKGGTIDEYNFLIGEVNGNKVIKDINKNTKTKGCSIDPNFDTMIHGTTFKVNFGKCGALTINNVIGVKVFNNENDLKTGNHVDSIELEHDLDKSSNDLIEEYYNEFKKLEIGEEVFFDSKFKYDAEVAKRNNANIVLELRKQGSKSQPVILTIDLNNNPFYEDNGEMMFKTNAITRGDNKSFVFNIPIKKVSFSNNTKQNQEPSNDKEEPEIDEIPKTGEEMKSEAKKAYDYILNNPHLKDAFYKAPSLWNLFIAELKGEKAMGTGILPTLQLLNQYGKKEKSEELGADFIQGKRIWFSPIKPYDINGTLGDFELKTDIKYTAIVKSKKFDQNYYLLDEYNTYKIYVKSRYPDMEDVFKCDFVRYNNKSDGTVEENKSEGEVMLKFYKEGSGYKPLNK